MVELLCSIIERANNVCFAQECKEANRQSMLQQVLDK